MPRTPDVPLSDTPHATAHPQPYAAQDQGEDDGCPRPGDLISVSDGKPVPGFQMKTSTGSLWKPLSAAKDEEEMEVVAIRHGAEFQGVSGLSELECELEGFDFPVLAFYRGARRVA